MTLSLHSCVQAIYRPTPASGIRLVRGRCSGVGDTGIVVQDIEIDWSALVELRVFDGAKAGAVLYEAKEEK